MEKDTKPMSADKNSCVEDNQQASDKSASIGEGEIKKYEDINPEHKALEDIAEIQSTDDV
jgi:hypothetical protein